MRVSQSEMDKSHQRIVKGASRLMRKHGIETTSVNDVMTEAGLTHGGFYRHFRSKEDLVSAALDEAFDEAIKMIEDSQRALGLKKGTQEYYNHYLSDGHVSHPELGCPVAALSMDVARSGTSTRASFANGLKRAIGKLTQGKGGETEQTRAAAIRKIALLAGAVMIARACDPDTAQIVLSACKNE